MAPFLLSVYALLLKTLGASFGGNPKLTSGVLIQLGRKGSSFFGSRNHPAVITCTLHGMLKKMNDITMTIGRDGVVSCRVEPQIDYKSPPIRIKDVGFKLTVIPGSLHAVEITAKEIITSTRFPNPTARSLANALTITMNGKAFKRKLARGFSGESAHIHVVTNMKEHKTVLCLAPLNVYHVQLMISPEACTLLHTFPPSQREDGPNGSPLMLEYQHKSSHPSAASNQPRISSALIFYSQNGSVTKSVIVVDNKQPTTRKIYFRTMPTLREDIPMVKINQVLDQILSAVKSAKRQKGHKLVKKLKAKNFKALVIDFKLLSAADGTVHGMRGNQIGQRVSKDGHAVISGCLYLDLPLFIISKRNAIYVDTDEGTKVKYDSPYVYKPVESNLKYRIHYPSILSSPLPSPDDEQLPPPALAAIVDLLEQEFISKKGVINLIIGAPKSNIEGRYGATANIHLESVSGFVQSPPDTIAFISSDEVDGLAAMAFGYGFMYAPKWPSGQKDSSFSLDNLRTIVPRKDESLVESSNTLTDFCDKAEFGFV